MTICDTRSRQNTHAVVTKINYHVIVYLFLLNDKNHITRRSSRHNRRQRISKVRDIGSTLVSIPKATNNNCS